MITVAVQNQLARLQMVRELRQLKDAKGHGTSLISLYIPAGAQLIRSTKLLASEYSTSSCIKARQTRHAVQDALKSMKARLSQFRQTPENGLALFSGVVVNLDNSRTPRKIVTVIEPPMPLVRGSYLCDSRFNTEPLEDMIHSGPSYGFVVVDGKSALFAVVRSNRTKVLDTFSESLPRKHNKGGQSQGRYNRGNTALSMFNTRLRYARKVAERMTKLFVIDDIVAHAGIFVAGAAEMKQLVIDDISDVRVKSKLRGSLDVAYGGHSGLREAIHGASKMMEECAIVTESKIIQDLMQHIDRSPELVRFGLRECMDFLRAGLCRKLILWDGLTHEVIHKTGKSEDACGDGILFVEEKSQVDAPESGLRTPLVDWVLENGANHGAEIALVTDNGTSECTQFIKGFSGMAAILNFALEDDFGDDIDGEWE